VFRDFQLNLTIDDGTGEATAYILQREDDAHWRWIADTVFGPFDTTLDVTRWLTRELVKAKAYARR
jgi:hypothetical protein